MKSLAGYKNKKLIVPDMRILILIKKSPISCRRILAKNNKNITDFGEGAYSRTRVPKPNPKCGDIVL